MRLIKERKTLLSFALVQSRTREQEKKKNWKYKYLVLYTDIYFAIFFLHQPEPANLLSVRPRERLAK
jgi:hypothetical protein